MPVLDDPCRPLAENIRNYFVHDRIPEGFLAVEVVLQRPLGDARRGENRIHVSAAGIGLVVFPKSSLQQELSRALWIARRGPPTFRFLAV
jgi:hypothetical protein